MGSAVSTSGPYATKKFMSRIADAKRHRFRKDIMQNQQTAQSLHQSMSSEEHRFSGHYNMKKPKQKKILRTWFSTKLTSFRKAASSVSIWLRRSSLSKFLSSVTCFATLTTIYESKPKPKVQWMMYCCKMNKWKALMPLCRDNLVSTVTTQTKPAQPISAISCVYTRQHSISGEFSDGGRW